MNYSVRFIIFSTAVAVIIALCVLAKAIAMMR